MPSSWSRVRVLGLALGAALALGAVGARADDSVKEADRLFRKGAQAYQAGDFRRAANLLDQSLRISAHGVTYYAAGLARQSAGDAVIAADYYDRAISSGQIDDGQLQDARRRLLDLDRSLGRLSVDAPRGTRLRILSAPQGVKLAGAAGPVEPPLRVRAQPGNYTVVAEFGDGTTASRRLAVTAGATASFTFVEPEERSRPATAPRDDTPSPGKGRSVQTTLGFVALGGAVLSVGSAALFWARAKSARDEYYDSELTDPDSRDRAAGMQTWTNVAWGTAAVLAGTGGVLLLTAPSSDAGPASPGGGRPRAWVGVRGSSVELGGKF